MSELQTGPIDVVLLKFPGNKFDGGIGPALRDLALRRLVKVVDLLFVYKDGDGNVGSMELAGLSAELEPSFVDVDGQLGGGLLDAEDVAEVSASLEAEHVRRGRGDREPLGHPVRRRGATRRRRADRAGPGAVRRRRRGAYRGRVGVRRPSWDSMRGMARTAVIAGTATAVSNRVSRRQANRWQQKEEAAAYEQQQYAQPQYAQPQYAQPAPAPAPPPPSPRRAAPADDLYAQLTRLAELNRQGILTDEEFSSAKARLLGI